MKHLILFLFTWIYVFEVQAQTFEDFDRFLQQEVQDGRLVGVHGMIFQEGKVVYNQSFGLRDRESKSPLTTDALYFIQSMTKPIVSVALMTLYDEGKFQLDDPVSKYLPEYAHLNVVNDPSKGSAAGTHPAPTAITIRQVLSHTAGMSHGIASVAYDKEIWNGIIMNGKLKTLAQRTEALAKVPLIFDPGIKWNYSFSPDVVGRLVEVLSGKTLESFLNERIFFPLEMKNSGYNLTAAQQQRVMTVYAYDAANALNRSLAQPSSSGNTLFSGVNALFTSTADYLRFGEMMLNQGTWNGKQLLKPETVALMASDQTTGIKFRLGPGDSYTPLGNGIVSDELGTLNLEPGHGFGLGFAIVQDPKLANRPPAAKGEYFWSGANSTHFFINPEKKMVAVFMTQVASVGTPNPYGFYFGDEMRKAIYRALD